MVKELRQQEVEKFLAAEGWVLARVKGGHNVWKSPDGHETIAIPRHGKVSPGVVRQIIKAVPNTRQLAMRKGPSMNTKTKTRMFAATAAREGKWWIITVPELDAVTQARNVREIDEMATGLVIALLDLEEQDVKVNVTVEVPESVAQRWSAAATLHAQAKADEQRAATLRREAVKELLVDAKMSQSDAAALLGVSQQRVQQLARPVLVGRTGLEPVTDGL